MVSAGARLYAHSKSIQHAASTQRANSSDERSEESEYVHNDAEQESEDHKGPSEPREDGSSLENKGS